MRFSYYFYYLEANAPMKINYATSSLSNICSLGAEMLLGFVICSGIVGLLMSVVEFVCLFIEFYVSILVED